VGPVKYKQKIPKYYLLVPHDIRISWTKVMAALIKPCPAPAYLHPCPPCSRIAQWLASVWSSTEPGNEVGGPTRRTDNSSSIKNIKTSTPVNIWI
jgi:hypothetical protein